MSAGSYTFHGLKLRVDAPPNAGKIHGEILGSFHARLASLGAHLDERLTFASRRFDEGSDLSGESYGKSAH